MDLRILVEACLSGGGLVDGLGSAAAAAGPMRGPGYERFASAHFGQSGWFGLVRRGGGS